MHRRSDRSAASRDARRPSDRRRDGRSARQTLCRANISRRRRRRKARSSCRTSSKPMTPTSGRSTWMTPETRDESAGEAPTNSRRKIGYPDTWRDYSALVIAPRRPDRRREEAERVRMEPRAEAHRQARRPQRMGHDAADHQCLLQSDAERDRLPGRHPAAALLRSQRRRRGELWRYRRRHRPRDQPWLRRPGRANTTRDGALQNWWTPEDRKNFDARTDALAKQYDAYEPLPGLHINGRLTLGENIADIAGLVIAYKAYHISLGGKPAPVLGGLPAISASTSPTARAGARTGPTARTRQTCCPTRTARRNSASTASCAMTTAGMRHST